MKQPFDLTHSCKVSSSFIPVVSALLPLTYWADPTSDPAPSGSQYTVCLLLPLAGWEESGCWVTVGGRQTEPWEGICLTILKMQMIVYAEELLH